MKKNKQTYRIDRYLGVDTMSGYLEMMKVVSIRKPIELLPK